MMRHVVSRWRGFLGMETAPLGHAEKLISAAGGFLGIFLVYLTSVALLGPGGAPWIVTSMGSSAVLLFAAPHGPMSQPWALVGGNLVSAVIGVLAAQFVPNPILAAALAVGLAIGAMHYLRCTHPPGGATALAAVVGGPEIHSLGYLFILAPVTLNVAVILAVAIAVNYPFAWRRYPASLLRRPRRAGAGAAFRHDDIEYALRHLGSYVDVTEKDLMRIYALATRHAQAGGLNPARIRLGHHYSNGQYGERWAIRQIVDESGRGDPERDTVIYKVVSGQGPRTSGSCTRAEFARWAHYEVRRSDRAWRRAGEKQGGIVEEGHREP